MVKRTLCLKYFDLFLFNYIQQICELKGGDAQAKITPTYILIVFNFFFKIKGD